MNLTVEVLTTLPAARPLTPAERHTIVLVCNGLTNKQVACQMDTSEQVIKNRMKDIYLKIGANRRGELISRVFPNQLARKITSGLPDHPEVNDVELSS